MIVHSCCCIVVFVMLGLIQIQNPFEFFLKKVLKIKRKRQSFPPSLFLSFGPISLASLAIPSCLVSLSSPSPVGRASLRPN